MKQLRTTVSLVFWTDTTNESEAIVAGLAGMLPSEDQAATLATVEYVSDGRPVTETIS